MRRRLEDEIRRYTQAVDAQAAPLAELLPQGLREHAEVGSVQKVEITIPLRPPRRTRVPRWSYALAGVAMALLVAVPLLLTSLDPDDPPAAANDGNFVDLSPDTESGPDFVPPDLELPVMARYPLLFDGETQILTGRGFDPNIEVVATLEYEGVVETRRSATDGSGNFTLEPFDRCCADSSVLTVVLGDETVRARIDGGITIHRLDAERDLLTLSAGGGFPVDVYLDSPTGSYHTTVQPDNDWYSVDLSGEFDVSPEATAVAVIDRDGVPFVSPRVGTTPTFSVIVRLTDEQHIQGEGFLPNTSIGIDVNGTPLPGGVVTDDGGHFAFELDTRGVVLDPGDRLQFSNEGTTVETTVPGLEFTAYNPFTGLAVGTTTDGSLPDQVTVSVRAGQTLQGPTETAEPAPENAWKAVFQPIASATSVEEGWAIVREGYVAFWVSLEEVSAPVRNPVNGHFYQAIAVPAGINWNESDGAARRLTFEGIRGHLATLSSAEELSFVVSTFPEAVISTEGHSPYWLGGFQPPGVSPADAGWQWVTGEDFDYFFWDGVEPNDPSALEQCLQFSHGETVQFGQWNDQPCDAPVMGYVVEFDVSS